MNCHIIANDGTITLHYDNKPYVVQPTHPLYQKIVTAIKGRKFKVAAKLAENTHIKQAVQKISKSVTIEDGAVLFKGQPVGGVVVERILTFVRKGLPYKPLVRFLENLQLNPSSRSVQELYMFLEHGNMPITDDGCFIGYKAITQDWKDKHTGTFDNNVGKTCEVIRNTVCDDFRVGCAQGLHIGSYKYANEFACGDDRIVLVKVNPADAVSVPEDAQFQKLRAWKYKVVAEVAREAPPLEEETFGDITPNDAVEPQEALQTFADSDVGCDECGEEDCDGYCC
jgi:hypothetical protein